jgi:dUTP pyrophosphatase
MNIKIKRFDKDLPLPEYKTAGAAGFDLAARETMTVAPHAIAYIPLNIAVETPADHFFLLVPRSSTHKKGLMAANSIGIIDSDYAGDEDEVKFACYNFTDKPVTVLRGDRIAQGMFVKFTRGEWEEAEKMNKKTRGGFGSTGSK